MRRTFNFDDSDSFLFLTLTHATLLLTTVVIRHLCTPLSYRDNSTEYGSLYTYWFEFRDDPPLFNKIYLK